MTKRLLLIILIAFAVISPIISQERVDLTVPETKPSNTSYHIERTSQDFDAGLFYIYLKGVNGESATCLYSASPAPTGAFLNNALNKANFATVYAGNATTGSLKQRIFHRLVVMGEAANVCGKILVGTVAGTVP